jgi:hypothetical protein
MLRVEKIDHGGGRSPKTGRPSSQALRAMRLDHGHSASSRFHSFHFRSHAFRLIL